MTFTAIKGGKFGQPKSPRVNLMRRMVLRQCGDCGHSWTQPSPTGRCAKCGGESVANLGEATCDAPSVK